MKKSLSPRKTTSHLLQACPLPRCLFRKVQIIPKPLPRLYLRHIQSRTTIRKRRKEKEAPRHRRQNDTRSDPAAHLASRRHAFANRAGSSAAVTLDSRRFRFHGLDAEDEFDEGAGDEAGGEVGREVVVQEELAAHDVEGDVVSCPGEEEETGRVVETRACSLYELAC